MSSKWQKASTELDAGAKFCSITSFQIVSGVKGMNEAEKV